MNHRTTTTLIALLGLAFSAATLATTPEEAIKYRQGILTAQKWNMSTMGEMVKGLKPYDKEDFAKRAVNLALLSKMLLEGFTAEGADKGESGAKAEVWVMPEKFKEGSEKLGVEATKLVQAAQGGDLKAIKTQFGEVQKACKGCHKNFRNE